MLFKRLSKRLDFSSFDGQPGGHGVTTTFKYMSATGFNSLAKVNRWNGAQATFADAVIDGDYHGGFTELFHQTTSDDTDNALVPAFACHDQCAAGVQCWICSERGAEIISEYLRQAFALIVFGDDVGQNRVGLVAIAGGEQRDVRHCAAQSATGIEQRP